jgi:hypothetical protein
VLEAYGVLGTDTTRVFFLGGLSVAGGEVRSSFAWAYTPAT